VDVRQHGGARSTVYARTLIVTTTQQLAVYLIGPTAAGKTDLALRLIERFPFEIISVDSAMVYCGLDIGSGKPPRAVLERVPHHLVDICDPSERYSAGQFVRDAERAMAEIRARGKVPLLVGGTMMYFKALTEGIADMPSADPVVRAEIDARARVVGWPAMHAELAAIDPVAAKKILPNDAQRIQRALEVFRLTGSPLSTLHAKTVRQTLNDRALALVWSPVDRAALYDRIALRFQAMMAAGFVDEVRRLYERTDLSQDLPAIRSVGYRQLWDHLAGEYGIEEAIRLGVIATRQLARRQLIWLRAMQNLEWFDSLDPDADARIQRRVSAHLGASL